MLSVIRAYVNYRYTVDTQRLFTEELIIRLNITSFDFVP